MIFQPYSTSHCYCDMCACVSLSKLVRSEKVQVIKDILSDMYLQDDPTSGGFQCGKICQSCVCMHMPR